MALLFPAVQGALDAAKRAQAKNDVVQIATAITAYETEYGKLPPSSSTTVDSALVQILSGISGNTNNPRQIVFLEVNAANRGKSETNSTGFVDPWGGPYQISLDNGLGGDTAGYDNTVTAGTNSQSIRKKVAVWNKPVDHTDSASAGKKNRRYVTSWE